MVKTLVFEVCFFGLYWGFVRYNYNFRFQDYILSKSCYKGIAI